MTASSSSLAPPAVNGFGYFAGHSSWARHAHAFFAALDRFRPVRRAPFEQPGLLGSEAAAQPSALDPSLPGIGIGPIEMMSRVRSRHRIAMVVWETTVLPADHRAVLQSMDQVWTPSSWGRSLLIENGLRPERVFVVPEGVDTAIFYPASIEETSRPHPFRFLCVGKWEPRKGIDDLIRSFAEEFHPDEDVELLIHANNLLLPFFHVENEIQRALDGKRARVRVSHPVPEASLRSLYAASDAFVLPTRAEGWGLPITEAMACGLPVIVTNYSAPTDYLTSDIAYLIPVSHMVPVRDHRFYPYADPGLWAQPDLDTLRRLMRHVFEHPEEAAARGARARAAVASRWTWDHAARIACALLEGN